MINTGKNRTMADIDDMIKYFKKTIKTWQFKNDKPTFSELKALDVMKEYVKKLEEERVLLEKLEWIESLK